MPEHAFRCTCGQLTRIYFDLSQYPYPDALPCRCGGQLVRFFEGAPGIEPDIWHPYFDHGLGTWVKSRAHRQRVAREKGFDEIMGKEEFERSRKAHTPKDEFAFSEADRTAFRDAADKAYNDLKYGNVPIPEPEKLESVDTPDVHVVES